MAPTWGTLAGFQTYWQSVVEESNYNRWPSMAYLFSNHSFSPPAFREESVYKDSEDNYEGWKYKFIDYWSSYDTLFWLLSELYKLQVQNPATLKLEHFVHTRGSDLKRFSLEDFKKIIPHYGEMLYYQLQTKLRAVAEDEAWKREMVAHHLKSSFDHFNTSYFDRPMFIPPHLASSSDAASKQWPADRREYECWAYKKINKWTPNDTIDCLIYELHQLNVNPATVNLDRFRELHGRDLVRLSEEDFKWMIPEYGETLYHQLQPKIKSCTESELPWREVRPQSNETQEPHDFSNPNPNQPLCLAHKQELPYAHPSCFRWKLNGVWQCGASASGSCDSALNLSKEHTTPSTGLLSSKNLTLEGSLAEKRGQSLSPFDEHPSFSSSPISSTKNNFSILSLTKESTETASGFKKENDSSFNVALSDKSFVEKRFIQDFESSHSHLKYNKPSEAQDSCSLHSDFTTQDSVKDSVLSATDSIHAKGMGSYFENSVLDHGYNSETNDDMSIAQDKENLGKEKRKPGRPRSSFKKDKSKGKVGRVWEFIRDLIMDPMYNPSVISWEDREKGLFRFRSGDQVAKLWGCKRGNPRMNFENFSRSIRQNYKKGYLLPVEKIRLVYQFGPRSTGWRPGDPPTRPLMLPAAQ